MGEQDPAWEAFKIDDDVLRQAVQGTSDLITVPGYGNVDFADVKIAMENMGMALMGTSTATGEHRAGEAAQKAIRRVRFARACCERGARRAGDTGLESAVGSGATADAAEGGTGWFSRAAGYCL